MSMYNVEVGVCDSRGNVLYETTLYLDGVESLHDIFQEVYCEFRGLDFKIGRVVQL